MFFIGIFDHALWQPENLRQIHTAKGHCDVICVLKNKQLTEVSHKKGKTIEMRQTLTGFPNRFRLMWNARALLKLRAGNF